MEYIGLFKSLTLSLILKTLKLTDSNKTMITVVVIPI